MFLITERMPHNMDTTSSPTRINATVLLSDFQAKEENLILPYDHQNKEKEKKKKAPINLYILSPPPPPSVVLLFSLACVLFFFFFKNLFQNGRQLCSVFMNVFLSVLRSFRKREECSAKTKFNSEKSPPPPYPSVAQTHIFFSVCCKRRCLVSVALWKE